MKTLKLEKLQNEIETRKLDIKISYKNKDLDFCKKYLTTKLDDFKDNLQEIIISIVCDSTFIFEDFNKIMLIKSELESGWYDSDNEEERDLFQMGLNIYKSSNFESVVDYLIDLKEKEVLNIKLDQIDFMKGLIKENE